MSATEMTKLLIEEGAIGNCADHRADVGIMDGVQTSRLGIIYGRGRYIQVVSLPNQIA